MSVGTIVAHVISNSKVIFCAQVNRVQSASDLAQVKTDCFDTGAPLPHGATGLADIAVKWTTLLLTSKYPGSDTVTLDGGGDVTGITENAVVGPEYLVVKDDQGAELSEPTVYDVSCQSGGTFTAQIKNGSGGGNSVGAGQTIEFESKHTILPMDKFSETLNASGEAEFTMRPCSGFYGSFKVMVIASGGDPRETTLRLRYT